MPFLAGQFKLSGGSIRNVSLAAAFLAAEDGGSISMRHLIRGVALEYGKLGRLTLESDFDRFHELIRPRNGERFRPLSRSLRPEGAAAVALSVARSGRPR